MLVTGAGAPVAISILKALRQSELNPRIIATDAIPSSVGLFRAHAGYTLPSVAVDQASYLERLEQICLAEKVSMVCLGSEVEMRHLAPHIDDIERRTGARLILNHPGVLAPFMDKWATVCVLRERNLPVPDSALTSDLDAVGALLARHEFPVILKPRYGSGSKNLFVAWSRREIDLLSQYVPEAVLQEYLLPDHEEYTVGVYKSRQSGYVGQIVLRRTMAAGVTYKAEVVRDEAIESVCRRVAESFDVWGPINVQLRKTPAGVRIFEINPRFSSSAVIRAHFGFNEPEMCLRDVVRGERLRPPEIRSGFALRYWDEIYLEPGEYPTDPGQPWAFRPSGRKVDNF